MNWLQTHHSEVVAVATAVLAVVGTVLAVLLWRAHRRMSRALVGALPVPRTPEFGSDAEGRLVLMVPLVNAAPWPAQALEVSASVDGGKRVRVLRDATLFGDGASVRPAVPWPMGVLDAPVDVRWAWRDGTGRRTARWQGRVRVPEQAFPVSGVSVTPPDKESGGAGGTTIPAPNADH